MTSLLGYWTFKQIMLNVPFIGLLGEQSLLDIYSG